MGIFIFLTFLASFGGCVVIERAWGSNRNLTMQLKQDALHDQLTKLPNRRLLMEQLPAHSDASARHQQKFAVMFLDLDGFKTINDQCGHDIGDKAMYCAKRAGKGNARVSRDDQLNTELLSARFSGPRTGHIGERRM
ncbi:diguanylate cyclase [Noviherbaspirillum saxi]|uniref:diguanylate cyclase n=1 Tax=Noviherbaspirillum saxi TaxID=2320863 RepID=UPI0011C3D53B|nr:GGDEF domain-containing protein [Noviherbaspirillum saxi]